MRFWEFVSVFRSDKATLLRILSKPQWKHYLDWYRNFDQYVASQNRTVLDASVPDEMCRAALQWSNLKFYVDRGTLRKCPAEKLLAKKVKVLNAVEVFERYGGSAIEETLERGSVRVI